MVSLALIISLFLPGLPSFTGGQSGGFFSGAPDGPGQRYPEVGLEHVAPGDPHPEYNSVPATSGSHFAQPLAPARWGIHDDPLPDEVLLHNLEHGGIGIHYNCPDGCPELVEQLSDLTNEALSNNAKVIMSPYPDMETTIAVTAWTFLDALDEFDKDRITDFVNAHESSPNSPEPTAR